MVALCVEKVLAQHGEDAHQRARISATTTASTTAATERDVLRDVWLDDHRRGSWSAEVDESGLTLKDACAGCRERRGDPGAARTVERFLVESNLIGCADL